MTFRLVLILLLLICNIAVPAAEPVVASQSRQIHSSVLGEDRSYQVMLPASYAWAPDRKYPVLYVLDGPAHFLHTSGSVSYLAAQGEIPEMIVVALASTKRVRDFTPTDWPEAWIGGGGAGNFRHFLAEELIPEVERDFRADGFRVLSGHSAAGQFALYCLGVEPTIFNAYFALSPSLDWDHNLPQRALAESFKGATSLPAFLYFAWSDDAGQALADDLALAETLKTQAPPGFRSQARRYPDETHGSLPLVAQIDALRALYAGYRLHDDMLDRGLPYAEQHFRDISKKLGHAIAIPEVVLNNLGYAELSRDKTADAIALFERAVAENPNSANAHDSLADGYAKAGRLADAVGAEERALALASQYDLPDRDQFAARVEKLRELAAAKDARPK